MTAQPYVEPIRFPLVKTDKLSPWPGLEPICPACSHEGPAANGGVAVAFSSGASDPWWARWWPWYVPECEHAGRGPHMHHRCAHCRFEWISELASPDF